ncbi:MAG: hypothetical protein CMM07_16195 [Rhodopirellula sp.]|nr:hypothetical protein [Rhodopirellula sp.]
MVAGHLPLGLFFSKCACGWNCYADWFSVATDVLANFVVANHRDVSPNDEFSLFRFDLAA